MKSRIKPAPSKSRDSLPNGPFVKSLESEIQERRGFLAPSFYVTNFRNVKSSPRMATKRTKKQTIQAVDKKGKDFLTKGR
jgi:hypothetical protein